MKRWLIVAAATVVAALVVCAAPAGREQPTPVTPLTIAPAAVVTLP